MVAHDPLHGSGRAELPHPALALGDDAQAAQGIFMIDANRREPAVYQPPHSVPGDTTGLANPPKSGEKPEALWKRAQEAAAARLNEPEDKTEDTGKG